MENRVDCANNNNNINNNNIINNNNNMVNLPEQLNQHPISAIVAPSRNFRGIPEPWDFITRPLMLNAWSQTTSDDFLILNSLELKDEKSEREKELEEKIKVLEENLKAHTELLSQIHATSARTSALLGQQQLQNHDTNNVAFNNNSVHNAFNGRTNQHSPKIVNAINSSQQVSCSFNESVKYRIIADGTGSHSDEPIEIQLAEDDGALNLNSSADSGRLEICLGNEENAEIKTEYHPTTSNTALQAPAPINHATPSDYNFIKKRKLAVEQRELPKIDTTCDNMQQKPPNQNIRRKSGNSILKTPKTGNNKSNAGMHMQSTPRKNVLVSSQNGYNETAHCSRNDACNVGINLDNVFVSIGPNNTRVPAKIYDSMSWTSASIATRKLLMATFDRKVLATHSMTGKPSPAFKDHAKPVKQMLDPLVISDIIFAVTRKCNVSDKEVRNAITTKCADENKMMKLQMNKQGEKQQRESNKENIE